MYPPADFCQMLHEKSDIRDFLHKLYSINPKGGAKKRRTVLNAASAPQVNALIYVIFYIFQKEIGIKKEHAVRIHKCKKIKFLRETFGSAASVTKLLNSNKRLKLEKLQKFTAYHWLLFMLFNKKKKSKM